MRPVMRACLLLLLAAGCAPAQAVSFGLKAGVSLTNLLAAASPAYHAATSRYTFGPAVRIGLPHRCGFEAGVLYKRLEYGAGALSGSAGRWEVPLLIEYSLRQPFLSRRLRRAATTAAKANPRITRITRIWESAKIRVNPRIIVVPARLAAQSAARRFQSWFFRCAFPTWRALAAS